MEDPSFALFKPDEDTYRILLGFLKPNGIHPKPLGRRLFERFL